MPIAIKERHEKRAMDIKPLIDFPREGETISSAEYTFRINAPEAAQRVEIAVDQGEWLTCRQSTGYWWCDWSGYDNGPHEIVSRLITADGKTTLSQPTEFCVQFEKQPE
ncbi:MAG: hypothetical protein AAB036_09960 [Elusimicrobiota bacterium]